MKNKFVVYTALFGDYDDLIDPKEKYEGCDFICFTDQKHLKSDIWEIRIVEEIDLPLNMMNRRFKLLPHLFLSEYDTSLYVDTNIFIIKNPIILTEKYLHQYNIAIPLHPHRNCIYDEAPIVIDIKKANESEVNKQINFYLSEGYPPKYGLTENNIIFRNHNNKDIINLMEDWFKLLKKFSKRDQLSLMYLVWKNKCCIKKINEGARGSEYFRLKAHKRNNVSNNFIAKLKSLKNEHILNFPYGKVSKINSSIKKILPKYLKKLLKIEDKPYRV